MSIPPSERFSEANYPDQKLTGAIIAAGYEVHRSLGFGFRESVYRRAMLVELRFRDIPVRTEVNSRVFYRKHDVGLYRADIIVAERIILELKTGLTPDPSAPEQLLNFMSASHKPLGLYLHFGRKLEIKRMIKTSATDFDLTRL